MKKYTDIGFYIMTNDEIKEALNCCRRYDSVDCLKCPLIKTKDMAADITYFHLRLFL